MIDRPHPKLVPSIPHETQERLSVVEYSQERIAAQGSALSGDWVALTCFGLSGESGEVVEIVKKHMFHGKPLDPHKFHLELGDVLWYLNYGGLLQEAAGCAYFDEFVLGFIAGKMEPHELLCLATAQLILQVGKCVAQLYFKEPYNAGRRELMSHARQMIWAIAALAHATGSDLETVARLNNEKLRERYPNGFSIEAAQAVRKEDL